MAGWELIYKKHGSIQTKTMPVVNVFVKQLSKRGKQNLKVLDLGCGTGRHSIFLLKRFDKIRDISLYALDSSKTAISLLNNEIKRLNLRSKPNIITYDLNHALPYKDQYFDGIICTLVIEHNRVKKIIKNVAEVKRCLKSKGLVALAVPSVKDPRAFTGESIETHTRINTKPQIDGNLIHHFFTAKEITDLFKGYKVIYKKHQSRPATKSNIIAKDWEYVLQKP